MRGSAAHDDYSVSRGEATLHGVTEPRIGLEILDQLMEGWESVAHLAIGEIRDDGSIDLLILLESGTLRYLTTLESRDEPGTVPASKQFDFLAVFGRQVLETNVPIVRRPSTAEKGLLLTVFPVRGQRNRVAYILEPAVPDISPEGDTEPSIADPQSRHRSV